MQPSDIVCTSLPPPVTEEPFRRKLHLSKHQIGMGYTRAEPYLATSLVRPYRCRTYMEYDLVDYIFIWGCLINWTRGLSLCNQSDGDLFQPTAVGKPEVLFSCSPMRIVFLSDLLVSHTLGVSGTNACEY